MLLFLTNLVTTGRVGTPEPAITDMPPGKPARAKRVPNIQPLWSGPR